VWGNHARVLDHLKGIQLVLIWAIAAYGAAALSLRCLDDVWGRFATSPFFGRNPVTGFRGWNLINTAVALVAAATTVVYRKMARPPKQSARWARASLPALGLLLCALVLSSGFLWRAHVLRVEAAQALIARSAAAKAETEPEPEPQPPAAAMDADAMPAPKPAVIQRAPADELAKASAKGANGLIPLAEHYPKDQYVLKPLLLAYASRSTGLADAMTIAQRLFDVAPEETRDQDLRYLVRKGANTPGETSIIAFSLMVEHMGTAGPDLLYDLMLSNSRVSRHADELLASEAVQNLATPALRIAYQLRKAESCAARIPLLDQAAELGDIRSVQVLSPLTVGSKRGCGRWKRGPCPAPCSLEARRYTEAIGRIMSRQPSSR